MFLLFSHLQLRPTLLVDEHGPTLAVGIAAKTAPGLLIGLQYQFALNGNPMHIAQLQPQLG